MIVRHLLVVNAVALVAATAAAPHASPRVRLVTYNVSNDRPRPADVVSDIRALTDEPPVVALQEARGDDIPKYRAALAKAYPATRWSAAYQGYNCLYTAPCYKAGVIDARNDTEDEGVALLSPFPASFERRTIAARDQWWLGRAAVRARIAVPQAGTISVIAGHGPVGGSGSEAAFISELTAWASAMPSPRFLGGDFNVSPGQANGAIYAAVQATGWTDAWRAFTGSAAGGETKRSRIDYWFWQTDPDGQAYHPEAMSIGRLNASDHRPLYAEFSPGASGPRHGWALHDDFDGDDIAAAWAVRLFSGSMSAKVPVRAESGALTMQLRESPSSEYNGVRSVAAYRFDDAEASVDVACAPSADASGAFAMFTVGTDTQHFYRWYVSGGELHAQKNAGSGKVELGAPVPLAAGMRRLRIRHDPENGHVVFERGDGRGRWEVYYEEPWAAEIPLEVFFELKGGTSAAQTQPGRVCWDDFDARGR